MSTNLLLFEGKTKSKKEKFEKSVLKTTHFFDLSRH
jgi:hypothetical protein